MCSTLQPQMSYPQNSRGHTLIEALATILLVSLGLLGIIALQLNATRSNYDGYLRSIAVNQAYDIIDRMRANKTGIDSGYYNNLTGIGNGTSCTSACTSQDVATRDQYEWNTNNSLLLPSGQGVVTLTSAANSLYTVTVRYDSRRTGATGTNCSGDTNVDLTCVVVMVSV